MSAVSADETDIGIYFCRYDAAPLFDFTLHKSIYVSYLFFFTVFIARYIELRLVGRFCFRRHANFRSVQRQSHNAELTASSFHLCIDVKQLMPPHNISRSTSARVLLSQPSTPRFYQSRLQLLKACGFTYRFKFQMLLLAYIASFILTGTALTLSSAFYMHNTPLYQS